MQSPPPPPLQWSADLPVPLPTTTSEPARPLRRRRVAPLTLTTALALGAALVGILLGGRVSAEDGIAAAREALQAGDAARAVSLDESVSARSGLLMVFDPGATASARHDGQLARVAWARQLGSQGKVDEAVAALAQVGEPALIDTAAAARTQVLLDAANTAVQHDQPSLALQRLAEAAAATVPASMAAGVTRLRGTAEVSAAKQLVRAGRFEDALGLLDDAATIGAAPAPSLFPSTLLAAARDQQAALDYSDAAATLQRLIDQHANSPEARSARGLLRTPQSVSGTLVDNAGHGAAGRVRLASHYSVVGGGYLTSGPFYYGTADPAGDFTLGGVAVGGPYVLEYYRGGWQTLVDPRTYQPANPVTVKPLTPADLTFIVMPG